MGLGLSWLGLRRIRFRPRLGAGLWPGTRANWTGLGLGRIPVARPGRLGISWLGLRGVGLWWIRPGLGTLVVGSWLVALRLGLRHLLQPVLCRSIDDRC